jgi:hypothetical protein
MDTGFVDELYHHKQNKSGPVFRFQILPGSV